MNSDDQMQKPANANNSSSQPKDKIGRDLIANSSLIKSYQAKDRAQKAKEDQVVLPELPGASKGKLLLETDYVKKLPSTGNVTNPFEGSDGKFNNLARRTDNINVSHLKSQQKAKVKGSNNDQDVSMYSAEQSFEELKEDLNSSIEGDANGGMTKRHSNVSQDNNGNRKQSVQAQKKINFMNLSPNQDHSIIESIREYMPSESYSPDDHHRSKMTGDRVESHDQKPSEKIPGFVLNIKETQDENSSGPSDELASNLSKQTAKRDVNDMIEKEIQQKLKEEILQIVGGPEPLYELTHKYAEGSDSPMWKRKQIRNRTIIDPTVDEEEQSEASASLSDGEEGSDLPGDQQSEKSESKSFRLNDKDDQQKKKKTKKNKAIQEKLERQGERIPVQTDKAVNITKHHELFGYMIYDGYRPTNLAQTRDYLEFMTRSAENLGDDPLAENKAPPHILEYLERDLDTVLPKEIDQRSILRFDQNFESGNLDSAYIINPYYYNLLLKVDSNTRGNTYWFYFSVQGFKVGQRYTFNIQNFTRSMDKFYKDGMNVLTRSEDLGPDDIDALAEKAAGSGKAPMEQVDESRENQNTKDSEKNTDQHLQVPEDQNKKEVTRNSTSGLSAAEEKFKDWKYGQCENILFDASDIPRSKNMSNMAKYQMSVKDKERYFYSMLSFSYRFKPEDLGKKVYFAYALPYGYSDLLHDLEDAKNTLVNHMSPLYNQEKNGEEKEQVDDPIGSLAQDSTPNYRIIDKTDIFDLAKIKNLSNFNNDKQYNTGQEIESPQDTRKSENTPLPKGLASTNSEDNRQQQVNNRTLNAKKASFKFSNKPNQSGSKANAQFDFMHDQIKKQATEFMHFKTSKFESDFIKREEKGANQLKEHILNEAAANPLSNQHNFEITNDYLQWRQEVIAQTMGGLNVFQITLTKRRKAGSIPHKKKQVIYIQARLHAAETHGSFIMSSLIKELSQNYIKYDQILKDNIIKLVPMVNPDGVVLGNSRSSLAGVDLNRRWSNPNSTLHPELYFLKMSMRETKNDSKGISIFCDLHGHNKNSNCFIFGCNKAPNEGLLSWTKTRLLPKIFASYEPIFDFNMCKFSQEKTKYNTARVVIWNEFKVTNSFTLETSQYGQKLQQGTKSKKGNCIQLFQEDFNNIGINLLQSINKFVLIEIKLQKDLKKNGGWFKKKILDEITGQSARSKLDSQHNFGRFQSRQNSESSRQILGAGTFAKKQPLKPNRRNTTDNLMLHQIGAKAKKPSSKNLYNQGNNTTTLRNENSAQKKRNSIRQGSEESLSLSDNGKGEKGKNEVMKSQAGKPNEQATKQLQNMSKMKDNNSFKVIKTEASPVKGLVDQAQSLSHKSPALKPPNNKKSFADTPKKPQVNKRTVPLPEQSKKKMKETVPEEPMKLPDCLAEFFSKNEFNSAVYQSQLPTIPKEADTISKQEEAESDSEPSCDNFEVTEMKKIFSNAISEEDLNEVFADNLEPSISPRVEEPPPIKDAQPEKANINNLNTVIEQISEHDEQQEQQSMNMSYEQIRPPVRDNKREPLQLPGTTSPPPQVSTQNEIDAERLREQIKSIQDYKQIAKQLKSAQMESKKLADKFDSLSRQLTKKIKDETKYFINPIGQQQQIQASLVSPQLFGNGWDQVRDTNSQNQYAAHARTSSLQPMSDINTDLNKARKQILPAGPQSGQEKSGERIRPRGASTNVIMHLENNSNLPAISQNNLNHMNLMKRGKKKTMATSQAKASKYKSRNNVLSMSAYNMENGLATLTKNANILGSIKAQQAQTHVHPQFAMTNQIMPKNQVAQGLNGVLMGHQVSNSPNQTSANRVKRKRKPEVNDQPKSQHPTSPNIKQPNMSHPLKSEQYQRSQVSGAQKEQIRTIGSMPINNNSFNNYPQSSQIQPIQRNKVLTNKQISMPVGHADGDQSIHSNLYQSESQSFAPSQNDLNHQLQQHKLNNQAMINQIDQIRKDIQTSPVQKGGFYLNSSLEWVQSNDNDRNVSPVRFPNQSSQEKGSENNYLRLQDLNMKRQNKLSPSSILFNKGNTSGNKLRKEVINARQNLEDSIQSQFGISQSINTAHSQIAPKNDYQEDYPQTQMSDNIHNMLHILPNSMNKNTRIAATDMTQNMIQFKHEPNQIARNSVQFGNQERSHHDEFKAKSQTTYRNQQIILKPHQIRRGAADQIMQQDQMNNEIINKQRRYNNTKFNSNAESKGYEPVSSIHRDHNSVLHGVPNRVSIANMSERNKMINIQDGVASSPAKFNNNYELTPQNMKHKMIKTKTQQIDQEQQAYTEIIQQSSASKQNNNQGLQSNYNKMNLSIVNSTTEAQVKQSKQELQLPKTTVISPLNKSRLNRLSYIQSNQVHQVGSPQQFSREMLQMNDFSSPANTIVNSYDQNFKEHLDQQSIQHSGQQFQEIYIEDKSRGSNSNYQAMNKNIDFTINQGMSRRYATNSNIPGVSPNKSSRNYGPVPADSQFGMQSADYVSNSIEGKIPQIVVSPRPAISQTPGSNFQNKIIRKSIPLQQTNSPQSKELQELQGTKRIHTESEYTHQNHMSPVRVMEATSTGIVTNRKTIAQFGDGNAYNANNSVMNERRHQQIQMSTPKGSHVEKLSQNSELKQQRGAHIKMSKQQVQNIIKQQMNKN